MLRFEQAVVVINGVEELLVGVNSTIKIADMRPKENSCCSKISKYITCCSQQRQNCRDGSLTAVVRNATLCLAQCSISDAVYLRL
eukprot:5283642-Pleurochrysis_carterae.AAC.1